MGNEREQQMVYTKASLGHRVKGEAAMHGPHHRRALGRPIRHSLLGITTTDTYFLRNQTLPCAKIHHTTRYRNVQLF